MMQQAKRYTVDALPNPLPLYLKALKSRPGISDGDKLAATRIDWPGFTFDEAAVTAYADACQCPLESGQIPLFFPHSYFGPLHLLMLTDEHFPLKVIGGVHQRNHLIQHVPLIVGRRYDAAIYLTSLRRSRQGLEVDFRTEVRVGEQLHWESLTTFLFRQQCSKEDPQSSLALIVDNIVEPRLLDTFPVPANTGKRFGRITRDINPIHMSKWLAKLFGFKRDLCHGMWALGRSLPLVENEAVKAGQSIDYAKPVRSDVAFKGPLYIGQDVAIKMAAINTATHRDQHTTSPTKPIQYELYSGSNERPCVVAAIGNVAAGSSLD
jgi:acyl dehydratase